MSTKLFADVTISSDPARINAAITHALLKYDERQARSKFYNRYALPQYLGAWQDARNDTQGGVPLRTALVNRFTGRLLDALLKALQQPLATRDELR